MSSRRQPVPRSTRTRGRRTRHRGPGEQDAASRGGLVGSTDGVVGSADGVVSSADGVVLVVVERGWARAVHASVRQEWFDGALWVQPDPLGGNWVRFEQGKATAETVIAVLVGVMRVRGEWLRSSPSG